MSIWLVMKANDGSERAFPIQKSSTLIGRETNCDVRVPIPTVAQKHCRIILDEGELRLQDLQTQGGTYHNGNRVQEAVLDDADQVTIGPVTFIVRKQPMNGVQSGAEIVIERQAPPAMLDGAALKRKP